MTLIRIFAEVVLTVGGGLLAAVLLCLLTWNLLKLVRHPEWGPPLALLLLFVSVGGRLGRSDFLRMLVFFEVLAALMVWSEGRAWRERHPWGMTKGRSDQ